MQITKKITSVLGLKPLKNHGKLFSKPLYAPFDSLNSNTPLYLGDFCARLVE